MTPFEAAGYRKSDVFQVRHGTTPFERGNTIRLEKDDGSRCPLFRRTTDDRPGFIYLDRIVRMGYGDRLRHWLGF